MTAAAWLATRTAQAPPQLRTRMLAEIREAARLESERRAALSNEQMAPQLTPEQEAMGILAGPANYEQRLTVAKAAVKQDPRRVAQVVRGWVNANE